MFRKGLISVLTALLMFVIVTNPVYARVIDLEVTVDKNVKVYDGDGDGVKNDALVTGKVTVNGYKKLAVVLVTLHLEYKVDDDTYVEVYVKHKILLFRNVQGSASKDVAFNLKDLSGGWYRAYLTARYLWRTARSDYTYDFDPPGGTVGPPMD